MGAQLYALPSNSQNASVVISKSEMTLNQLIVEIEGQTDYIFVYNKKDVDADTRIRLSDKQSSVENILDTALEPTNYTYQFENNYISLSAKAEAQQPQTPAAQSELRSGIVMNGDGEPLPGVTVILKDGNGTGAITDIEGHFRINATTGQILTFSFLGYEPVEAEVPRENRNFRVVMTQSLNTMDEVVVVGMGSQRRASVIGSISNVNVRELKVPNRSLSNSFAGRLAGVVAVQRNGEPGYDNSDFWIRGISTFGANKTPLVLVDGVERADAMNNIDPEEIESVSILKDASATAVYGVRAANGVVLITTRRGEAKAMPSVELKMEYGVSQLTRVPNLLGAVDYMTLYNEALGSEKFSADDIELTRTGADPYLYPDVNWLDQIFKKNSNNKNVAVNVTGGGK
jgi:TonB-linked SusC/RagA family outer membrane protein